MPWFPALREAFPLVFFGAACLVLAGFFGLTHTSPFATRVPLWLFLLLLGGVAVAGGLLSSQIPDEEGEESVREERVPETRTLESWDSVREPPRIEPISLRREVTAPVTRPSVTVSEAYDVDGALDLLEEQGAAPDRGSEDVEAALDSLSGLAPQPVGSNAAVGPIDDLMVQLEQTEAAVAAPAPRWAAAPARTPPPLPPTTCVKCERVLGPSEDRHACATCKAPLCIECSRTALHHEEKLYCPNCAWLEESLPPLGPSWRDGAPRVEPSAEKLDVPVDASIPDPPPAPRRSRPARRRRA